MSYIGLSATLWAWTANVSTAPERLVLLALAKHADEDGGAYPSADTLAEETKLNRKTVFSAIASLCDAGLVARTHRPGQGRRNQYELNLEHTENGTYQKRNVPKTGLSKSQKRDVECTENGTLNVPKTEREERREEKREKRSEERRNRCANASTQPDADLTPVTIVTPVTNVPLPPEQLSPPPRDNCLLDPVTIVTPIKEEIKELNKEINNVSSDSATSAPKPKRKPKPRVAATDRSNFTGLDGVLDATWNDLVALRKSKRAPISQAVIDRLAKKAEMAGMSLNDVMATMVDRGWIGFEVDWIKGSKKGSMNETDCGFTRRRGVCPGDLEPDYATTVYTGVNMPVWDPEESAEITRKLESGEYNF